MIRKGFESVDLMKLKRIGKKSSPEQQQAQQAQQAQQQQPPAEGGQAQDQSKANPKMRGEAFISRFAGKRDTTF